MQAHPLATLVSWQDGAPTADHVPLEYDAATQTLRGHVARANPLWRETRADIEVLVVFQGPQAYISPGWYATKAETGKVVPTWNYIRRARGRLRVRDDAAWSVRWCLA
jgi:transcriptional regulator